MSLEKEMKILADNNIEFDVRRGLSNFYYTALVFKTRRLANKATKLLDYPATVRLGEEPYTYELVYYVS